MGCALFRFRFGPRDYQEAFEGYNITQARAVRGLSAGELAARVGLSAREMADLESNRRVPTDSEVFRLCRALDFPRVFFWRAAPTGTAVGHMCGPGVERETCRCGFLAGYLCDWPMGGGKTCDLPLCEGCAVPQGEPGDDIHYCRQHALMAARRGRVEA